jgi:hypothetical protein
VGYAADMQLQMALLNQSMQFPVFPGTSAAAPPQSILQQPLPVMQPPMAWVQLHQYQMQQLQQEQILQQMHQVQRYQQLQHLQQVQALGLMGVNAGMMLPINLGPMVSTGAARGKSGPPMGGDKPTAPQFEVNEERLACGEEKRTTFMVRNIPNKYTQMALLEELQEFRGLFDFLYVPINSRRGCNIGYAFVNFVSTEAALSFHRVFKSRQWLKAKAPKLSKLAFARLQGREALIAHFQNTLVASHVKPECRPLLFLTEGDRRGEIQPFPFGSQNE